MTPALRRRIAATSTTVLAGGLLTASLISPSGPAAAASGDPYTNASLPVSTRVSDLLSRMSLDDKLGQMTQVDHKALTNQQDLATYKIGSVLSGGSSDPSSNDASAWTSLYDGLQRIALSTSLAIPMIYGIDAVHGHSNVTGATIFPHNIGLGATRDPDLAQRIGRATAEEIAATGIDWTFSPCLCVARNDRWGRTYESFGEKPEIATSMSTIVTGLQTSSLSNQGAILATAKHYIGDGGTTGGVDQGNTQLGEPELRAIHLPPFKAAVDKGVGSVMISYSSWNGQKLHGNRYLISELLKGELGFKGFVVSDWAGIDQIDGASGISSTDVVQGINAGIDMVMVPNDYKTFLSLAKQAVQNGQIFQSRVDDAVTRILTKKFELGLFERPYTDRTLTSVIGSAEHRAIAREAVRKSLVLLKNQNNVLPLAKTGGKIFVAGKNADDIGNQSGGWTISWQGSSGSTTTGTTILSGIRSAVGSGRSVTYSRDGSGFDSSYSAAIAVVGETPYAEGKGDRTGSLGLDSTDLNTLSQLQGRGVPVIVVLVSGRPLDIASQLGNWNALVAAWLPGTEGNGVSDVLFGDYAPTGKLPVTWMQSASQQPINDGDGQSSLFPYGYGLTYTSPTTTTTTTTTRPTTTTTTTTTRPTTTTTTTRPTTTTTTTTTRPTTSTCQPAAPGVSSVSATSITWAIPASPCASVGSMVRLFTSQADALAGTNVVASGFADFGITTLTVNGLKSSTDYWWSFGNLAIGGPTRTAASPTTTTTIPTTTTTIPTTTTTPTTCTTTAPYELIGRTATSLTFAIGGPTCIPQAVFGVSLYDSAARTTLVASASAQRPVPSVTLCGLRPDTDYWASFMFGSSGGPYRTLTTGASPTGPTYTTTGNCASPTTTTTTTTTTTAEPTTTTTTTPTTTTSPSRACTATYKVLGQWQGGFQAEVTVTAGAAGISGWTLGWPLASGQGISQFWNTALTTSGGAVTAKNLSYNGSLGAGASTTFGFLGSWTNSNTVPVVTCTSP